MKLVEKVMSLIVVAIGIYMVVSYWGPITPPLLSGIAFSFLGCMQTRKAFRCCGAKKK